METSKPYKPQKYTEVKRDWPFILIMAIMVFLLLVLWYLGNKLLIF